MRRIGITLISLMMVAGCASGPAGPALQDTTSTVSPTGQPTTPVQPVDVSTPSTSPVAASTTTTVATSTTTSQLSTTTSTKPAVSPTKLAVAPWFLVDEPGHHLRTGPFLLPVHREVPYTLGVGRASLEQLFAGPTTGETDSVPAISTTIPEGVEVLGLTIKAGLAVVDLSSEFEGDDDSPVVAQRMAQVVFTLTSIPNVVEVLFRQDGKPIPAQTSEGQLVDRPVMKADYLDFAAAITVESPTYWSKVGSPLRVTGFAAAFEATFRYVLTDGEGLIIEEGIAMTTNGTGWGGFDFTIQYEVDREQIGALIVWVDSAEDGSKIDVREYPVVLTP